MNNHAMTASRAGQTNLRCGDPNLAAPFTRDIRFAQTRLDLATQLAHPPASKWH